MSCEKFEYLPLLSYVLLNIDEIYQIIKLMNNMKQFYEKYWIEMQCIGISSILLPVTFMLFCLEETGIAFGLRVVWIFVLFALPVLVINLICWLVILLKILFKHQNKSSPLANFPVIKNILNKITIFIGIPAVVFNMLFVISFLMIWQMANH